MTSTTADNTAVLLPVAIELVKSTSYFYDANDEFITAIASKLVPITANDGHVFIEEGEPITTILFLESGTLIRTKLIIQSEDFTNLKSSLRTSTSTTGLLKTPLTVVDIEHSIVVDELNDRGRITGLLHCCTPTSDSKQQKSVAYATVSAKGQCKVWELSSTDFRSIISSNPSFAFNILNAMSRDIRSGSRSLQAILARSSSADSTAANATGTDTTGSSTKVIKVLCYDTTSWVREGFQPAIDAFNNSTGTGTDGSTTGTCTNKITISMDYTSERLGEKSVTYAAGYDCICLFVNDNCNERIVRTLSLLGIKLILMRCAGFDRVDTKAALAYGVTVVRVPAYSPYAVAEFAVTLLMSLNRKITKSNARVKMANFSLDAGLMGMDIYGKTIGIMGTGNIGIILLKIMLGFGANVICYDIYENKVVIDMGAKYVSKDEIFTTSDVIFLMMPLFPSTKHIINDTVVQKQLKKGVYIINTSRGGLIDTNAVLKGLQQGIINGLGIDVYENEEDYFFQDYSARTVTDPILTSLLGEPNVIMSAHQAFFTKEAITKIIDTTITNITMYYCNNLINIQHPNNCLPKITIPTPSPSPK